MAGHFLDRLQRRDLPVEPTRLQPVDGLIGAEARGQRREQQDRSATAVDAEDRGLAALGLDRDQRRPTCVSARVLPLDQASELLDRGRAEDRAEREVVADLVLDRCEQRRGDDRPHAEIKEVVGHADLLDPELTLPDPSQTPFELGARLDQLAIGRPRTRRLRQRLAVDLPVRSQRERPQRGDRRGDHIHRQLRRRVLAQLIRRDRQLGHHIRGQLRARALTTRDDHSINDIGMTRQHRLDLTKLDPEPVDLHLMIDPPQKIDIPIRATARQITRAIDPSARSLIKRIRHEPLLGQIRPAAIPTRQPIPTDPQLPDLAIGHRLHRLIQDQQRRIRDRTPDRDRTLLPRHPITRRPDRRLSRPIHIPQLKPQLHQPIGQHHRQRLPTTQPLQPPPRAPPRINQHPPRRRRRLQHRRARTLQQPRQRPRIRNHLTLSDHQPRTNDQRQIQLQPRDIKRQRRDRDQHIIPTQTRPIPHRPQKIHQRTMRDLHTLRLPRRPRRINHIRQLLRITHHLRRHRRTLRNHRPITIKTNNLDPLHRQPLNQPLLRQHNRRPRIRQHKRLTLHRIRRINRHIRTTRLQHPQQPHKHLHRPLNTNPHQHLRPHPTTHQKRRQPRRTLIQLTKRQRLPTTHHRHSPRRTTNLLPNQLMQTTPRIHSSGVVQV